MEIKKPQGMYEKLISLIESAPEKALSWFIPLFKKLGHEERDVLVPFIIRYSEDSFTVEKLSLDKQMHLKEIINEIDSELIGSGQNG